MLEFILIVLVYCICSYILREAPMTPITDMEELAVDCYIEALSSLEEMPISVQEQVNFLIATIPGLSRCSELKPVINSTQVDNLTEMFLSLPAK